jgi:hypothetical protein
MTCACGFTDENETDDKEFIRVRGISAYVEDDSDDLQRQQVSLRFYVCPKCQSVKAMEVI